VPESPSRDAVAALLQPYKPVMTVEEVATVLRFPDAAVRRRAADGVIPGHKIGGKWRFLRDEIAVLLGAGQSSGTS